MDFKVIFRDSFVEDLERIVRLIASHNPAAAGRFGELVIRTSENLSFFPERDPDVRQRPGVRRFIVKKYFKVFYRVQYESRTVEMGCTAAARSDILTRLLPLQILLFCEFFEDNAGDFLVHGEAGSQGAAKAENEGVQFLQRAVEDGFERQGRDVAEVFAKTVSACARKKAQ